MPTELQTCSGNFCGTGGWAGPLPGDPGDAYGLTATPAFGGVQLTWNLPGVNPQAVAYISVYRGFNPDFALAVKLSDWGGSSYFDQTGLGEPLRQKYYWVRVMSVNGTPGQLVGPASAVARPTVTEMLEILAGQIGESELGQALKAEVARIPVVDQRVAQETLDRIQDNQSVMLALNALDSQTGEFRTLVTNELVVVKDAQQAIVNVLNTIAAGGGGSAEALVQVERDARIAADAAIALDVTTLYTRVEDNEAAIIDESIARTTAINATTQTLNTQVSNFRGEALGAVATEANTRASADTALGQRIDTVQATATTLAATVQTNNQARIDGDAANAQQITTVQATANGKGKILYQNTTPAVADRLEQNLWVDTTNNANTPKRWNGTAWVVVTDKVATDAAALAETARQASITNAASIVTNNQARIDGDAALASQINTAQTTLNGAIASAETRLQANINIVDGKAVAIGARWTAIVDVNGLIGGFGIYNNGQQVDAGFDVDFFWVGRTTNKRKPFIIQNGEVFIDKAVIGTITADQIDTRGLTIRDTNGQIILSAGASLNSQVAALASVQAAAQTANWGTVTGRPTDDSIRNNLIDLSWWRRDGTWPWATNGEYNRLVSGPSGDVNQPGPRGGSDIMWYAQEIGENVGEGGGGWNSGTFVTSRLDPSKAYRLVVPIRRMAGTGTYYWGGYGLCELNTTAVNTNPYFAVASSATLESDRWYLFVGYVYPYGSSGNNSDAAGVYDCKTGLKVVGGTNYNHEAEGMYHHRAYQFYASLNANCLFGRPFCNVVDGTEPSLREYFETSAVLNQALVPSINAAAQTANWGSVTARPSNIASLVGNEGILNGLIGINSSGQLYGIGAGDGVTVSNQQILVQNGTLTGIGTPGVVVDNNRITVDATTGAISGIGGGDGTSVANNQDFVIRAPGGGVFTGQTAPILGALKIRLPQFFTNTMLKFTVEIYEYNTGFSCTLELAGYNYQPDTVWYSVTARVVGGSNVEYPVFFGHDGTRCCVWIDSPSTGSWVYPQVRIRDVFAGYSNFSKSLWENGWQISFDQTNITSGTGANQFSASVEDTLPGSDWRKSSGRPANLAGLSGSEPILNSNINITLNSNGTLSVGGGPSGGGSLSLASLGAGAFSTLNQITAGNISTYIAGAAIDIAQIKLASITNLAALSSVLGTVEIVNGGYLRSGSVGFNFGDGFAMGWIGGEPYWKIGNDSTYIRYKPSTGLEEKKNVFTASVNPDTITISTPNSAAISQTVNISLFGGVEPFTYSWSILYSSTGNGAITISSPFSSSSVLGVYATALNSDSTVAGYATCTVRDANGRVAQASVYLSAYAYPQ